MKLKPLRPLAVALAILVWGPAFGYGAEDVYHAAVRVQPLLRTTTTSAGDPIAYPQTEQAEVTALLVEIPPGVETGWHEHPVPVYAYMLEGTVEVEATDGRTRSFSAGEAFAEMVNRLHNGRNTGSETVRLVMFVTGEKDAPFTIRMAEDG